MSATIDTKLNWLTRAGWMACAMPELLKNFVWDAFVLFFYAQVVGLKGGYVGVALLLILLFDAFVNPYIGAYSDRLSGARLGRRHTLMAAAVAPFAIGVIGVFSPPEDMAQLATFAWLVTFGLIARIGISFWSIPAYALGGDLSRHDGERRLIAVLRNLGNQFVILVIPPIAFGYFFASTAEFPRGQLNPAVYPKFGLFVAAVGVLLMIGAFLATYTRARAVEAEDISPPVADQFGFLSVIQRFIAAVRVTPNVGRVFLVTLLVLLTMSVMNQLSLHLATYFWRLGHDATRNLLMAGMIGTFISMPLSTLFMKFAGPKRAMVFGLSGFFLLQAAMILLPLLGIAPSAGTGAIGVFIVACRLLSGIGYGLYVIPFNAVTYDVADEHRVNTDQQQQGFVASLMFTGLQLGSAIVGLLAGSFLGVIAFPAGLPVEEMPKDKIDALAYFALVLILIAGALVAYIVSRFQVSNKKQREINARLSTAQDVASTKAAPAP